MPEEPSVIDQSQLLQCGSVPVVDTFAEAFPVRAARLIVTAASAEWARTAAREFTGFATSVIACDLETALERELAPEETPDGRPGVSLLAFAFDRKALGDALTRRVGQCILTCPTTACYDGLSAAEGDDRVSVGGQLRYFGDGFQFSKKIGRRRLWRIPTMDGEFVCEDMFGTLKGVAGGNLILCGATQCQTLQAAEAAVAAIRKLANVILPFPGGIVRSGSKVGSRYQQVKASTNDAYCPTLRGVTKSALPEGVNAVYELVMDGLSETDVHAAMKAGLHAAVTVPGLMQVTAGNYGGKLGKHHFHLREMVEV